MALKIQIYMYILHYMVYYVYIIIIIITRQVMELLNTSSLLTLPVLVRLTVYLSAS